MPVSLSLSDLIDYTDWERQKWYDWFRQQGNEVLKISCGLHGDGRFGTVGELVRHIFSAEKRYVDRLCGRTLTDTASVPSDNLEALFQLSQQSRKSLKDFVETFPAQEWDVLQDFKIMNHGLRATPKKIVVHVLMHEIRHWAQIATLLRLNGLAGEFHDFLFSPSMGGEFRRDQDGG
ncbi:MAG: DinB family protein [Candidatus Angelobacter sp.]